MLSRTLLSGVLAAAVATTFLQAAAESPASSAKPQPESFMSGRITETVGGGSEPVEDAAVTLWWIPGIDDAKPGDVLPVRPIAVTETDANGGYDLSVNATSEMKREAAENGGWVNFDVGVVDPELGKTETTGVSRRLVGGEWQAPEAQPAAARLTTTTGSAQAKKLGELPAVDSATTNLVLSSASPSVPAAAPGSRKSGSARVTAAEAAEAEAPLYAYCSFIVDSRPKRSVDILEWHNAGNSNAKWTYGNAADSDIDSGIQYAGKGDWKVGATRHVGNSNSSAVSRDYTSVSNSYATSEFEFIDGHYQPYGIGTYCKDTSIRVGTRVKNPVEWYGGVDSNRDAGSEFIGCDQAPQSDHRSSYPVGATFVRSTSNAAEIKGAVDIGPINVGAQSGFSKWLDVQWTAKRGHGIWLCGTNHPAPTAGVIHAQNRP